MSSLLTLSALAGYRTYIVAAIGIAANGLHVVAPQLNLPINEINTVLGFLGLGTLRAAVPKK
jgi:hypothetical protein